MMIEIKIRFIARPNVVAVCCYQGALSHTTTLCTQACLYRLGRFVLANRALTKFRFRLNKDWMACNNSPLLGLS